MKTKILLAVTAMLAVAQYATAEGHNPGPGGTVYEYGSQQVVVTKYYYGTGYEYASRLKRFHYSFSSFDFYSPVYTEAYWYNFTPYTWGVSIYDDWYYYGAGVSRYNWRSGFGGSYWWGYDPWMDYDPWMGYGWNSWYSPGFSYGINYYLGRPDYHYPVAWNRWNHYSHWDSYRPVYIVNNNHYNTYVNTDNRGRGYNPSRTNSTDRRSGYTVINGRSTGSNYSNPEGAATRIGNAGTGTGNDQGTRSHTGNNGKNAGQESTGKDKSNNGLRMGQNRRGVAEPTEAKPNEPARPNNPNVNDRTDPGREKAGTRTQSTIEMRAPVPAQQGQQTQTTVRTSTPGRETTVTRGTTAPKEKTIRKSAEKTTSETGENNTSKSSSGRRSNTQAKKR